MCALRSFIIISSNKTAECIVGHGLKIQVNEMNLIQITASLLITVLASISVNADQNDLRFLDGHNIIAGLVAKGKARKDYSGFVLDV